MLTAELKRDKTLPTEYIVANGRGFPCINLTKRSVDPIEMKNPKRKKTVNPMRRS